jgi:hypothetical protein
MHRRGVRVTLLLLLLATTAAAAFVLLELDRRSVSSIVTATHGLDAAAHSRLWAELSQVAEMKWITVGVAAALLLIGVFALTPRTSLPQSDPVEPVSVVPDQELPGKSVESTQGTSIIDLASLASLCTDLSRLTTIDALPELLGRSARVLNASGLILWLGVGDRLLPLIGHGYSAQVMSRLQPALRTDDTAAVAAWRTAEQTIVRGIEGSNGAIAVPLLGVEGCVGVLALELGQGREHEPQTHAAAALIAAQLATVVPTPAAASPDSLPDSAPGHGPAAQAQSA